MSNSMINKNLKNSRNNSKYLQTLTPAIKLLCPMHNQPIIKVQIQTKSLLCPKCEQMTTPMSIQQERIKATGLFRQFIKQFKHTNDDLQKTISMFKQPGVPELKKIIKSTLPQLQQLIDRRLEEEIEKGNERMKREIDKELEEWNFLNQGEIGISSLQHVNKMLEYKEIFQEKRRRINQFKNGVKYSIVEAVKRSVREYYQQNLII